MATPNHKSISHLPVLYNPFLNCIFNNPQYFKSPFKSIIDELKSNHTHYTILVPPANVLHEYYDPSTENSSTKTLLRELCYNNEDFIKSHIISTAAPVSSTITPISKEQLVIYNTLNNKQVLIKNRLIYTGKGFRKSLKLNIASILYFTSFCDYFPKGSKFMVIYIESTLFGGSPPRKLLPPLPEPQESNNVKPNPVDSVTFEKLLRSFPLLSKAVSDKFYRLFHHNNYQFRGLRYNHRKKLAHIRLEFLKILEEAFKIILDSVNVENPNSEQTYNLINHIISMYPGIDLNKLVHEYVELNLYDVVWAQLIFQFNCPNDDKESYDPEAMKILTSEMYEKLSCLSLNQLDLPVDKPWQMNELHERVSLAVQEFEKLADSSIMNLNGKTGVINNTLQILAQGRHYFNKSAKNPNIVVSADTLIGLLIMVVVHSKIDNLEAHMYYIKYFNSTDHSNDGQFNYMMSNLDAVLFHFSQKEYGYIDLIENSKKNYDLWNAIKNQDLETVQSIVDSVSTEYPDKELPENHFLKSKNINGESCLLFAIKAKNFEVYDLLINLNVNWISIDDILFEKNVTSNQNLLMCALIEESHYQIMDDLVDIIMANATPQEQYMYFNQTDLSGRSVGHYLFHNYKLIARIGHLIDWELKDNNSHTPLFSLCRCYDHAEYTDIITAGFDCVYKKYGDDGIDFDRHIDKSGNTLLHVLLKGIPETRLLSNPKNLINVNQLNLRCLSPLMLYVKYNRLENLKEILQDPRLDFFGEDFKNHYNVFDYLSFLALKSIRTERFQEMEKLIFTFCLDNYFPKNVDDNVVALNGKYDVNKKDWLIFFKNGDGFCNYKSINSLRQMLYLTKLKHPLSCFPEEDALWKNFSIGASTTPMFHKVRINRLIENFNILFQSLVYLESINRSKFYKTFLSEYSNEVLVLEQKQRIGEFIESEKQKLGDVTFKLNQIQEIEFFLDFSSNDLRKYTTLFNKLAKLVCIGDIKQVDNQNVLDMMIVRLDESTIFRDVYIPPEVNEQVGTFSELRDYIYWIQMFGDEVSRNISKLVLDIKSWKEIYYAICHINLELKQMEPPHQPELAVSETTSNGTPHAARSDSSLSIPQMPEEELEEEHGFLSNFVGTSKKTKYKKLIVDKSEAVKAIMKLNLEIKWAHEVIASEISNFLKFRTEFLRFGIKRYINEEIKNLRQRNIELAKVLYNIKHRK
ncbi:hypothetical protein Cantr_03204 [Candida viswanathii]|uniref:VPS9 domain-containing protein n=1 Tax=Candida viswanathii TaxID=5486 RepID=A0A367YPG0_9ASCO|nr:hypothetical protein Cantr_03204 [Candida viswanathii]